LEKCLSRFLQPWPALLSYFESHEDRERPGRVKGCAHYVASVEMKAYFMYLSFFLEPLNAFNTIFQTDATQIGILIPEMNRLLRLFMAKFHQSVIKSATDLTKVSFADRSVQLVDDILTVGMAIRAMVADSDDDLADSTRTRIFKSVRHFYVAIVEKMVKIFPFHDTVLKNLSVLNPDPKLRDT